MRVKVTLIAGTSIFEVVVTARDYEQAKRSAQAQNPEARVVMVAPA